MKPVILPVFLLSSSLAYADLQYVLTPDSAANLMKVSLTLPVKAPATNIHSCNWAPGSYSLSDIFKSVTEFTAKDEKGKSRTFTNPNPSTWAIDSTGAKQLTIEYKVPLRNSGDNRFHWSGPSTYLYPEGRTQEKCKLEINKQTDWQVFCGLDLGKQQTSLLTSFTAPTYDTLADNPVSLGKLESDTYTSHGVQNSIVYVSGDPTKIDRVKVKEVCQKLTDMEGNFFGGVPFKKYIWHVNLMATPDGGWGLEHLSSTQVGVATGFGLGTQSVLAHELFHAWNVKRIRSSVLGPFDYTQLPKTGNLWWLEGVTDYYAAILPHRNGLFNDQTFLNTLGRMQQSVTSNTAFKEVSAYDSSFRVGEANNGRGNSNGFRISYYDLGWLVGMCLDIELRERTKGKHSLDDVMHALFDMCKNSKPGFQEHEIRNQLIRFGGKDFGPIYDSWVTKAGELPITQQLAKVGLERREVETVIAMTGVVLSFDATANAVKVTNVITPGNTVLKEGDVVKKINAFEVTAGQGAARRAQQYLLTLPAGQDVSVEIERNGEKSTVKFMPAKTTRKGSQIASLPYPTEAQLKLRQNWYSGK